MREQLGLNASAHGGRSGGPSEGRPQESDVSSKEQTPINGLKFGASTGEALAHMTLESCSTNSDHDTGCSTPLTIGGRSYEATLTFSNDHLVQVLCLSPNGNFADLLPIFIQQYGSPKWTDLSALEREWTSSESEITLSPYFGFTAILKSYQAVLKARNAKDSGVVDSGPKGGQSLKETLDWLKEKIPLSIYHYSKLMGNNGVDGVADTTVTAVPVRFDSCSVVFDVIDHSTMPNNNEYESYLTQRHTVPLGSLIGGGVMKRDREYFHAVENIEKWEVLFGSTSKVVLEETYLTSSWTLQLPLPGSPRIRDKGQDVTERESVNYAALVFNDKPVAQRILEALRHAAELCRGKEAF
jgi:hypothetical protein